MFFQKNKKEDEEQPSEEPLENPVKEDITIKGDISLQKLTAEVEKLKAQFSSFYELQKVSAERFTRVNEQVGELRAMIMDRDRDSKMVEAKATQAIDLVQSVQPDKLMIDLKKVDNRVEMIRSMIESNELIMNNTLSDLKEMRQKINSIKGLDESLKLSEEVKQAWLDNKKIDANITKHSSKVETIYSDMWKKFSDFEKFSSITKDADKAVKQLAIELDSIKIKISSLSDKKETQDLISKFEMFEKYVDNLVSSLNKRIINFEKGTTQGIDERLKKLSLLLMGFQKLAEKTPDLNKYFDLMEQKANSTLTNNLSVEKIKVPGQDDAVEMEPKKSFFGASKPKKSEEE